MQNMKNFGICILILLVIEDVTAKVDNNTLSDGDELACCPGSSFLVPKIDIPCFNPVKNITTPNRVGCMTSVTFNFTVKPGGIEYEHDGKMKTVDGSEACYGNVHGSYELIDPYAEKVLVICDKGMVNKFKIFKYAVITSVVFLSATAIIYAVFPELRDIFGMSITNFCGSLAIYMVQLLAFIDTEYDAPCVIQAFSLYFFSMAAFFWSNSISIQILRDTRRPSTVDGGWKEFRWYFLYSWGVPTILTSITAIVEYHPGDHKKPGLVRDCWFSDPEQAWYYRNSIMLILLIINLGIFVYVATTLWRFTLKSTYLKTLRYKLSMTIRLILVMGLPWLAKTLGLAAVDSSLLSWFVLELITALQGILIFLVLVVRKKVMRVLHQRGLLACCSGHVERWLAARDDEYCDIQPAEDLQTNGLARA